MALGLPSICHASANVSRCPALLNLPPNSPDAQVFYQFAKSLNHGADSPSPTPIGGNTQQRTTSSGGGPSVQLKSGSVWVLEIFPLWALLWHFACSPLLNVAN
uniref:Uncharacterized protein n=1 Tax=Rhizophora mucronata TaxID=61149 RepID=A0A2P2N189_RHIMU